MKLSELKEYVDRMASMAPLEEHDPEVTLVGMDSEIQTTYNMSFWIPTNQDFEDMENYDGTHSRIPEGVQLCCEFERR